MVLLEKIMEPLGAGALLWEVCHWGRWALHFHSLSHFQFAQIQIPSPSPSLTSFDLCIIMEMSWNSWKLR